MPDTFPMSDGTLSEFRSLAVTRCLMASFCSFSLNFERSSQKFHPRYRRVKLEAVPKITKVSQDKLQRLIRPVLLVTDVRDDS